MPKYCAVFIPLFTSLKDWEKIGILNRELYIYHKHFETFGTRFMIFTCGDDQDKEFQDQFEGIEIVAMNIRSPLKLFVKFFFLPFFYNSSLKKVNLIKIDQMWSAWIGLWFSIVFSKRLWARMGYEQYQLQCSQKTHFLKRYLVYLLSLLTYKKASVITVTTESIKNFVIRTFAVSPEKIYVKANYIDTNLFKRIKPAAIVNRVLYIGRIDKVKNLFGIIDGCKSSDFGLDIIGQGPLQKQVTKYANEKNININFLGIIPNQNLPRAIEQYRYFILASFHEGNPKSLLEAMSMGCACIATDVPGIKGIIRDQENGFLAQTDGLSIGKALKKAKESCTIDIQKNARKYVLENNSLEKLISFENELI